MCQIRSTHVSLPAWLAFLAILVTPLAALAAGGDLLWFFQGIEDINAMATLQDVDGDLVFDILVETYDAGAVGDHIYLLSGGSTGTPAIIWSNRPESGASNGGGWGDNCLATSDDLNADGFPDVLLGTAWGNRSVHALDGITGDVIWTFDTYNEVESGWVYSVAPHPDRTDDGVPEVVFGAGSNNETGYMLNGATGMPIWRFYGAIDAIWLTLSLPDMNDDGVGDVLFCGADNDYNVYCVSGASSGVGVEIWQTNTGGSNHAATVGDDINGDGKPEVVVGNWTAVDQVKCLDGATGSPIWAFHNGSSNYAMRLVTISDVTDDGVRDIALGSWARAVRVIDGATGDLIWQSYAGSLNGGDFWAIEKVKDVNGDGLDEVVGGSFDYNVYLFNGANGDTLWMYYTGNRLYSVRGTEDLSGNGVPDVLAGTQYLGSGGRTYALEGGEAITGVGERVRADGRAEVAATRAGQVDLRWTCNQPLPFLVYRYEEEAGKAVGRQLLAKAFEQGELRAHEVLQAIVAEAEPQGVLLTPEPLMPASQHAGAWTYAYTDRLGDGADPDRYNYRLAALMTDGSEVFVLDLQPNFQAMPRPLIVTAAAQPNPFNPVTAISFELDRPAMVSLVVHDVRGRQVASLPATLHPAGPGEIRWQARRDSGQDLPSGAYFFTLRAEGESQTLQAVLLK